MTIFMQQLRILLWKNFLLKRRNLKSFCREILIPIFFILILTMMKGLLTLYPQQAIHSFPKYPIENTSINVDFSKTILVSPNTPRVRRITLKSVDILQDMLDLTISPPVLFFPDMDEMYASYVRNKNVTAGIVFQYDPNNNFSYAIRMPFTDIASTKTYYKDKGQCREGNELDSDNCLANTYLHTGFCALQTAIDNALIREQMQDDTIRPPQISVQMMPKSRFQPNTITIQVLCAIFLTVGFSQILGFIFINTTAEKESKIKDAMKVMGMTETSFWLSWGCVYFFVIIIVATVTTVVAILAELFVQSNMFIFFMILVLYGVSQIAITYALSPFFHKAQDAGSISSVLSTVVSLIYLSISLTRTISSTGVVSSTISPAGRCFFSLFSPAAFALALDKAIFLDITGGMNFYTITEGDLPLYAPMLMLIFDSIFYVALVMFVQFIISKKRNSTFPWLHNVIRYRRSNGDSNKYFQTSIDRTVVDDYMENVTPELKATTAIRFSNVTKTFESKGDRVKVLDGFSFEIYENQITCLLGHNGAGKTTLINMICGLQAPTTGAATVCGYDVSDSVYLTKIRTMIGVCSQHEILYDDLTCAEHIKLYAGLKGVTEHLIAEKIEESLREVGLEMQRNQRAKNLSGGQKRKLSVAIALIGNPTVLILDEPTAGMDPCSRRRIWKLLKDRKHGKTIILSTHFMDEADILADRKAIISRGRVLCSGSSLFLKNKFGIGYHLNMLVENNCKTGEVTNVIRKIIPEVQLQRSHGKELVYTLPLVNTSRFSELFGALELRASGNMTTSESMGITSYGVSMTTLEEVFLKLEEDDSAIESEGSHQLNGSHVNHDDRLLVVPKPSTIFKSGVSNSCSGIKVEMDHTNLKARQFRTLFKVRMLIAKRNKKFFNFVYLILPVLLIIAANLLSKYVNSASSPVPLPLNITRMIGYYARMKNSSIPDIIPPLLTRDLSDSYFSAIWMEEVHDLCETDTFTNSSELTVDTPNYVGIDLELFDVFGFNVESILTILYDTQAVHALPAMINFFSNSILQTETFIDDSSSVFINTVSLPWPRENPDVADTHVFSSMILAAAFVIIAPAFAVDLVKEKQRKCKTQLKVAGVTGSVYWTSYFAVDVLKQCIPAVLAIVMVIVLEVDSFFNPGAILSLILILITYIPASTLFAYVLSFSFSTFETCQTILPPAFMSMGLLPFLIVALTDMFSDPHLAAVLHCIFCVIDCPYTIFGGVHYISRIFRNNGDAVTMAMYFRAESFITVTFILSIMHTFIFFLALKVLDNRGTNGNLMNKCHKHKDDNLDGSLNHEEALANEETDVIEERERVSLLQRVNSSEFPIAVVENLRKEFSNKRNSRNFYCNGGTPSRSTVAVDNITFAVDSGEVFGLLGPNGAGKSTTIQMLIADVKPTLGNAFVGGCDVRSSVNAVFEVIGYCPQHDALWESITLREHLRFYAKIRGINEADVEKVADWYINGLGIAEHQNKYVQNLSGGTKRKLSYAISLLGQPKIVLLDEPSTGLDPASKRLLWNTISNSFSGSEKGAILTTHSMEEADALCSRIGIMVNGKFECVGISQHLKNKYGSGYFLEVKIHEKSNTPRYVIDGRLNALDQYIKSLFPDSTMLERFGTRSQYKIPKENSQSLARIFTALEKEKSRCNFEEYSFSQSTLEQIFLEFAKKQRNEEDDNEFTESDYIMSHDRETVV